MRKRTMYRIFLLLGILAAGAVQAVPAQATFPGRNGRIALARSGDVYTMRADGTDLRRVTSGAAADLQPVWSPDGTQIAFARLSGTNFEVMVVNRDGSNLRRVTFHSGIDWHPSWSRDGRRLAFQSNRTGNYDIFTVRLTDPLNVKNVTRTAANEGHPSFAPNSERVAFQRTLGDQTDLFSVVDSFACNGYPCFGSEVRYTNTTDRSESEPNWTPDGGAIAHTEKRGGLTSIRKLWLDNGSSSHLMTHYNSLVAGPVCSPSGRYVVYTRVYSDIPSELWKADCQGGGTQPVRLAVGGDADWQRLPYLNPAGPGETYEGPDTVDG